MIEVQSLSKYFNNICAVNDMSFKVQKGEVLGFLGPNGAGKSTTMKMLTGFLAPSSGNAWINGFSILSDIKKLKQSIGYVPENAPLYEDLSVYEFLDFIASIRQIPSDKKTEAIRNILQQCSLESVENRLIETLSKGFRRRVSLAQALIHDPEVLILDEPTDGLDPNQKYEVRQLIKKITPNKCIIISTHILEEVLSICSKVVIIGGGTKLYDGTPEDLRNKSDKKNIDDVFRRLTTSENVQGVHL